MRAGIPKAPLAQTGKAGRKTGTQGHLQAGCVHHDVTEFNYDTLAQRLRELAFLNKGLTITLTDERDRSGRRTHEFHYSGGIAEFIKHLNRGKNVLHDKPIHFEAERDLPNGGFWHGSRAAVQRRLLGEHLQLRQQHQHRRRRHAPDRLPHAR